MDYFLISITAIVKMIVEISINLQSIDTQHAILLFYSAIAGDTPRVVISTYKDLRLRIIYECHDKRINGHRRREKTNRTLRRDFYWQRQYDFVRR